MIKGIGHIGIIVRDIEKSLEKLSRIIDFQQPSIKTLSEMQLKVALVELGDVSLEFLQSEVEDSPLAKAVKEKGDTIHHFCLLSDNIDDDVELLKNRGVEMIDMEPIIGVRGKRKAMSKPSALNGIPVELSEP